MVKTDKLWINGNVYANHWICLCGAVYEFDGWDKLRAEGKAVKKLKGFMRLKRKGVMLQ